MGRKIDVSQYKILASTSEKRLCYSKGHMWIEDENLVKNMVNLRMSKLSRCRLTERIIRLTPRLGFSICGEFYFSLHGQLFHVDVNKMEAHEIYHFRSGMNNPLTICKREDDNQEVVYWGEYWENSTREQVSIFKFDGNLITNICTIAGIKHIHLIVWDKYRECFWVTTGDSDDESKIYKASKDFDKMDIVFSGKQIYRTCALFPLENGLLYATDSPLCCNSLMFSEKQKDTFLEPVVISPMPGPCIFSQEFHDNFYFSTSVEPNPNLNKFKYAISRKISPGNIDKKSHVICVTRDLKVNDIFEATKDIHNMFFFQFGNIQLSYDTCNDALAAYCTSLRKYDGKTVYLSDSRRQ